MKVRTFDDLKCKLVLRPAAGGYAGDYSEFLQATSDISWLLCAVIMANQIFGSMGLGFGLQPGLVWKASGYLYRCLLMREEENASFLLSLAKVKFKVRLPTCTP